MTGSNGPKSKYGELGSYTLEKEMKTHSSILAGKNPMNRGALQAMVHGVTESDMPEATEHTR